MPSRIQQYGGADISAQATCLIRLRAGKAHSSSRFSKILMAEIQVHDNRHAKPESVDRFGRSIVIRQSGCDLSRSRVCQSQSDETVVYERVGDLTKAMRGTYPTDVEQSQCVCYFANFPNTWGL